MYSLGRPRRLIRYTRIYSAGIVPAKSRNFCDFQGRLAQVERSWEAASERMRKWRANEKIERKWRENEKMEREKGKWRETLVSIVALRKTVKIRSLNEF